jgi:hypothetical protein
MGKKQNRQLELMARVPCYGAPALGLDWQTWMREKLIDYIVPSNTALFDIDIGEFVSMGNRTGLKVLPTLWQEIPAGVETDESPDEEEKRLVRYTKPKTREMFFAQAMLSHRAGADGLQFGFACDEWKMPKNATREERARRDPHARFWLDDLGDPDKVEFADKQYTANPCPVVRFEPPEGTPVAPITHAVVLRIGDDIPKAREAGFDVRAEVIVYGTPLAEGEGLAIRVNGQELLALECLAWEPNDDTSERAAAPLVRPSVFQKDWWKWGGRRAAIQPEWLHLGENTIELVYTRDAGAATRPVSVTWLDLTLHYEPRGNAALQTGRPR